MKSIGDIATGLTTSISQDLRQGSVPAAPRIRYDRNNLPAVCNYVTDVAIPKQVWSAWKPAFGSRAIIRSLRDDERAALHRRVNELEPVLRSYARPQEDDRVAAAFAGMFGSFPSMRQRGENVMGRVSSAMHALKKFPAWAIERACQSIQSDGYVVKDQDGESRVEKHWPPSDAEVADVVHGVVNLYASTLVSAQSLLAAPVETPDDSPRPTKEEIEAKLGRPIADREAKPTGDGRERYGDGKHAQRVQAELDARRARKVGGECEGAVE